MSLYVKSPIEKMNDALEAELNAVPDTLTFEAIETNYVCPDCNHPLKKLKFVDPHGQRLSANWDTLYCTECNSSYYLHDIIWKLKGINIDGGGSGGSSVNVRLVDNTLVITDN